MTPDLRILGAGVFGLSCAIAALRRDARVTVHDPHGPGAGASGGVLGALAPHVPEPWNAKKAFQLDALLMGRTFWPEVEALTGLSTGYVRSGRLQPVPSGGADAARARRGAAALRWGDAAVWDVIPATGAAWEPPAPDGLLIRDTLSAHLHPARAVAAMAAAVEALGGTVTRNGPPEDAAPVIHATGVAGLAALSEGLDRPAGVPVKGQAAVLDLAVEGPQLFVDGLHVVPHRDGTVAVGSTTENGVTDLTTDGALDDLVERARALVPALGDAPVIRRWAGLRPRARTRAPVLGAWPSRPGRFVANGGFKIGFGMAPLVGEVMADLVLDGLDRVPDGFRVEDCLRNGQETGD